ncbi:MAG: single-stranded DNA-binding protein [Tissierellia bacterium]|nr:single-stranded DNA-binding protein [Tissierellia bacterium]
MNNVSLVGRLTADPDLRYIQSSNTPNVRFTLAVDKGLSREKRIEFEQQNKPTADFIRCVAWGRAAEVIAQYVAKGDLFGVNGRIETSSSQGKDGQMRYYTDVIVNNFYFLQPKGQGGPSYQNNMNQNFNQGGFQQGGYGQNQGGFQQGPTQGFQQGGYTQDQNQNQAPTQDSTAQYHNEKDDVLDGFDLEEYGIGDDLLPSDDEDIPF